MGPVFSSIVLIVTIIAAFMVGIAISRRLVAGVLHLMMQGRLKHAKPVSASVLQSIESR